jgi:uncharacterized protein (TIGR03437 family)
MGQGAILNVHSENTFNSVSNPAPQGSAITLFATGAGLWNASFPDGSLVLGDVYQTVTFQPPSPAGGVSLTIGGQPAKLLYAAIAPGQVWGFLQINAIIPTGIGSGPQPVVLKIGDNDNSQQKVTVAVQ